MLKKFYLQIWDKYRHPAAMTNSLELDKVKRASMNPDAHKLSSGKLQLGGKLWHQKTYEHFSFESFFPSLYLSRNVSPYGRGLFIPVHVRVREVRRKKKKKKAQKKNHFAMTGI